MTIRSETLGVDWPNLSLNRGHQVTPDPKASLAAVAVQVYQVHVASLAQLAWQVAR